MDSEYLKQHVGEALAVGLSEIVEKRPVDPIEYLAHWLRKYVENRDFDLRKKEEEAALEIEKQAAEEEKQRQMKMKEEAEAIARQEAYEKAAQEEVVVDTEPRPIPPEVSGTLPPLAEGDEEETEKQEVVKATDASAKNKEMSPKEEGQLPTLSEDDENSENAKDTNQKDEQMEQIEETNETEESVEPTQQLNAETDGKFEAEEQKGNQEEKGEEKQTADGEQSATDKPDAPDTTEERPGDTTKAEKE